ncbi:MAG TPA: adenosylhomocysteinase [Halanaerobiales bacterium]|nr:adenosylhomocysteinase [Halanaerobiales bacterium]
MESNVKDLSLAPAGKKKINWVKEKMTVLNKIKEEYKEDQPLKGKTVSICLHLEAKTAYMAVTLSELGADVYITGSNPLSTQDDVAAALTEYGVTVYSWRGETKEEYDESLNKILEVEPDLIIDDGGDLVSKIHNERPDLINKIIGGAEETTTGIIRLRSLDNNNLLKFPMMSVNDAQAKYLFDNRYGTGQSVWDGIMRTTNMVVAGKDVVIAGYGWCGKGVARRAKGLGARVIVTEVDPFKAIEAKMDGFRVMPMNKAAKTGDIFITVTGCKDVINKEHFKLMKNGAILANAGHFNVEINVEELKEMADEIKEARENIEGYKIGDKTLYLLAEGRLVNLAAGDGHPVEIMDMSFGLQVLSLLYLSENDLRPGLYKVPDHIDKKVAKYRLKAEGTKIDSLSPEQKQYLENWQI